MNLKRLCLFFCRPLEDEIDNCQRLLPISLWKCCCCWRGDSILDKWLVQLNRDVLRQRAEPRRCHSAHSDTQRSTFSEESSVMSSFRACIREHNSDQTNEIHQQNECHDIELGLAFVKLSGFVLAVKLYIWRQKLWGLRDIYCALQQEPVEIGWLKRSVNFCTHNRFWIVADRYAPIKEYITVLINPVNSCFKVYPYGCQTTYRVKCPNSLCRNCLLSQCLLSQLHLCNCLISVKGEIIFLHETVVWL